LTAPSLQSVHAAKSVPSNRMIAPSGAVENLSCAKTEGEIKNKIKIMAKAFCNVILFSIFVVKMNVNYTILHPVSQKVLCIPFSHIYWLFQQKDQ
jgi:hypothetical protein